MPKGGKREFFKFIFGFWNAGIVLNSGEISHFSSTNFKDTRKILPRMIGMDTFEVRKNCIQICYPSLWLAKNWRYIEVVEYCVCTTFVLR